MRRCRGCGCIPTLGAGDAEYRFASPLFRCNPPPHKNFGCPESPTIGSVEHILEKLSPVAILSVDFVVSKYFHSKLQSDNVDLIVA